MQRPLQTAWESHLRGKSCLVVPALFIFGSTRCISENQRRFFLFRRPGLPPTLLLFPLHFRLLLGCHKSIKSKIIPNFRVVLNFFRLSTRFYFCQLKIFESLVRTVDLCEGKGVQISEDNFPFLIFCFLPIRSVSVSSSGAQRQCHRGESRRDESPNYLRGHFSYSPKSVVKLSKEGFCTLIQTKVRGW